jgi:glycosyltransferase involved in cell wall biosynthesis
MKQITGPKRVLVAVDLVLRIPRGVRAKLLHPLRRYLYGKVDYFLNYFRDVSGVKRYFNVGQDRSEFVEFKVNLKEFAGGARPEGDYVLCFGRSLRDYETFFEAVEQAGYPAAIAKPDWGQMGDHGARWERSMEQLPANLKLLEDGGGAEDQIRILSGARMVVLPILPTSLVGSGISTALNAMALGKCVIGTTGPGMNDVFDGGEMLFAPPSDARALAEVIRRAWEDEGLRRQTAEAGWKRAVAAGGEQELYQRIIEAIAKRWKNG